eukprot:2985855-Lingulodinium_polyedra.AAC.1
MAADMHGSGVRTLLYTVNLCLRASRMYGQMHKNRFGPPRNRYCSQLQIFTYNTYFSEGGRHRPQRAPVKRGPPARARVGIEERGGAGIPS